MTHSFEALEGQYLLSNCPLPPYKDPQCNSVAVRMSFLDNFSPPENASLQLEGPGDNAYSACEWNPNSIFCINIGKELYIYAQENQHIPIDRRVFKAAPTCHAFRAGSCEAPLLVGLSNGEMQLIYPTRKDFCRVYNEERSIDKTSVTCIAWVPESPNQYLVSHVSGNLYLYDVKLAPVTTPPSYELFKGGIGFSVYTCKAKSTRNPLYRWSFSGRTGSFGSLSSGQSGENTLKAIPSHLENGCPQKLVDETKSDLSNNWTSSATSYEDTAAVNQFAFSPCGVYLALVTQDGYLLVVEYHTMELYGYMRSYFAGLLCVDWSPDSRFIVVGGQDDLITVWSMAERAVICRGEGHRSWISTVRFDPFLCPSRPDASLENHSSEASSCSRSCATSDASGVRQDGQYNTSGSLLSLDSQSHNTIALANTYRLGSVGQDTMFCLWDLTEDVIRQGVMFVHESAPPLTLEEHIQLSEGDSLNPPISAPVETAIIGVSSSSSGRHSLRSPSSTTSTTKIPSKRHPLVCNAPTQGRNVTNLFGFLTLNKRKSPSYSSATIPSSVRHTNPPVNYGSERLKNPASVFSRFTLHSSGRGIADGSHATGGDSWTLPNGNPAVTPALVHSNDSNRFFDMNDPNLFGSPMCPRFSDVPVLEPIVCTIIHQHRLSDLAFRPNSVHIVCQQGLVRTWSRPMRPKETDCLDDRASDSAAVPVYRKVPSGTQSARTRQQLQNCGPTNEEGNIYPVSSDSYLSPSFSPTGPSPTVPVPDSAHTDPQPNLSERKNTLSSAFSAGVSPENRTVCAVPTEYSSRVSQSLLPTASPTEAVNSNWCSGVDPGFRTNVTVPAGRFYGKMESITNSTDL
ncbi:WD repeat-containing protein 20 [Clonorchis sinensis]|uniref:WD repeat-containing protein 20 n=1 Tax=Clonorchis sinensis TaxID=79923 RepID=A0A8T1MMV2_CLOSI|nr:WD repeat-containing protein 20 [Clonorchis sinensis]